MTMTIKNQIDTVDTTHFCTVKTTENDVIFCLLSEV